MLFKLSVIPTIVFLELGVGVDLSDVRQERMGLFRCLCDENDLTEGGGPKNMNINIGYTFGRECEKTGRGGMRQSTSTPETALVVLACRLEKNASLMGWCLL